MKISVIIPTCNRNDLLTNCLQKLAPGGQSISFKEYEVIVTDDSNGGIARDMIFQYFPWVKWVAGLSKGPASNRNNGVKYASGKWIAFTDDDCLPDFHWLEGFVQAIDGNKEINVFEGRTYADRPKKSFAEVAPVNENGGHLPSCNFLIEKSFFEWMNGFDETYKFNFEDMDLHYRLKKNEQKVLFVPQASVCHPWRKLNIQKLWKDLANQKTGICCFIEKHPEVLRSFNSIHFIREAILNTLYYTLPKIFLYKGAGFFYGIMFRYFEIKMSFVLLPATFKFFLKYITRPSLAVGETT